MALMQTEWDRRIDRDDVVARPGVTALASDEHAFLEDLSRRSFEYFREQTHPITGLVADRAPTGGFDVRAGYAPASIAAVGFGLTAWCLAADRGWTTTQTAADTIRRTLRFLHRDVPHHRGFYYHFIDAGTGQRAFDCEVSSVDTALLMAGVLTAREYMADDAEIVALATGLFDRVEWPWMLAGGQTLSMGWRPRRGFIRHRWDNFSEHLILTLLAMGSSTHPLPPEVWHAWSRGPLVSYAGRTFMQCTALFVHQFPHAWIDFRGLRDDYADYWHNSVDATLAHRQMFLDMAVESPARFGHYGPDCWGVTASDSIDGYRAWGGPAPTPDLDGTVVPCAAAGSLPFAPRACLRTLRAMRDTHGSAVYGRYGFADAFNPANGWVAEDVIGIDAGITLLMAENARSGAVWNLFMRCPEIRRGLAAANFTSPKQRQHSLAA